MMTSGHFSGECQIRDEDCIDFMWDDAGISILMHVKDPDFTCVCLSREASKRLYDMLTVSGFGKADVT